MTAAAQYAYALYDTEFFLEVFLVWSVNFEVEALIVCVLNWIGQWIHNLLHVVSELWVSTHIFTKMVDEAYVVSI